MEINVDKVMIKTEELISLRERVSSADAIASELVLENIRLRTRALTAEKGLENVGKDLSKIKRRLRRFSCLLGEETERNRELSRKLIAFENAKIVAYLAHDGNAVSPGDFAGGECEMFFVGQEEGWKPLFADDSELTLKDPRQ